MDVAISDDFKDDEKAALKALAKTSVAVFYITTDWFKDNRSQREWNFAKNLSKPMIYIFHDTKKLIAIENFGLIFDGVNLIATINDYGNKDTNAAYLKTLVRCYQKYGI